MYYNLNRYFFASLFLLFFIIGLWVFNQKKNFFPVLSLNSNISFKSSLGNDYSDISSSFFVYQKLKNINSLYTLDPKVIEIVPIQGSLKQFTVIGRKFFFDSNFFLVYEFKDSKKAQYEFNELAVEKGEKIYRFKNLIIESSNDNPDFLILKEHLNEK